MSKTKSKPRKISRKPAAEDPAEVRARHTAERVMQTVLEERDKEAETERLEQWVSIECPHCGESIELQVTAEMDGQSMDQDCAVCCRSFIAHVGIEDGEASVSVDAG